MNLIIPDLCRTQPRLITKIDRSHWLARGLKIAYNPAVGPVNLVTGKGAASFVTIPPIITKDGYAMCREGSFSFDVNVPPPLTIHTIQLFDGSGISDRICGVNGSGSGWRYETSSNAVQFTFGGVGNYSSTAILSDVADYDTRAFGVTTVVSGTSSADIRFFGNGKLVSNTTSGSYVTSPSNFDAGDATCALLLVWGHAKSDAEVAAINLNPWQIFEQNTEVWFPAAGGAAFQAAWAANANTTIQAGPAA